MVITLPPVQDLVWTFQRHSPMERLPIRLLSAMARIIESYSVVEKTRHLSTNIRGSRMSLPLLAKKPGTGLVARW